MIHAAQTSCLVFLAAANIKAMSTAAAVLSPEVELHSRGIMNQILGEMDVVTSVYIPTSVITIDRHAFQGCSALASFAAYTSVTSIANAAFYGWMHDVNKC